jgi:hypothetical protein
MELYLVHLYALEKYKGAGRIDAGFVRSNLTHKLILKDGS